MQFLIFLLLICPYKTHQHENPGLDETKNEQPSGKMQNAGGAVYTRWGRKTCPENGTSLIYSGIAAGGHYYHSGAATEYVCLPENPDFRLNESASNPTGYYSSMYGGEYEDKIFGHSVLDKGVPCAVCLAENVSNTLMIPAKSVCVDGWRMEYTGRLASQSTADNDVFRAGGQYVCVDLHAEGLNRKSNDLDGKLFYAVLAKCDSLPCPPYIENEFLTCVVCSK